VFPKIAIADDIIRAIADIVRIDRRDQFDLIDLLPLAIYVTDPDGVIDYFNPACSTLAGRTPTAGRDRWCVTWKLYTNGGEFLPHDQCPMAVSIQTKLPIRGSTAIAERPDGTRINFLPFPTPVLDEHGEMLGAVNMLINLTDFYHRLSEDLTKDLHAWQTLIVRRALASFTAADIRHLIGELEAIRPRLH
jgi:PAS fold